MFQQVTNVDLVHPCLIPIEEENYVIITGGSNAWSISRCKKKRERIEERDRVGGERMKDCERERKNERERERERIEERQRERIEERERERGREN